MGVHPIHAAISTTYVQTMFRVKARQLIRRPGFCRSERQDLEQELATFVLKEAHLFDPARAGVNTFIAQVVDSAVAMILRGRRSLKRTAGCDVRSLDRDEVGHERDRKPVLLGEVVDEDDLRRRHGDCGRPDEETRSLELDAASVLASLSPELQDIARRLSESPEAAVARDLGTSRRQVRKAVAAIRVHFEAAGLTGT